ncbi:MAG TPA: POTRA domain-containing protein [Kofleriaceae bacterium]|nr:POTRA domain-containing protein [Kofleriaceae bacterium]
MIRSVLLSIAFVLAVLARGAAAQSDPAEPVRWTEFEIVGNLIDEPALLRRLFEPEMRTRKTLDEQARNDLAAFAAKLGYQLVDTPHAAIRGGGVKVVLVLDPVVVVRWVDVTMKQSITDALLSNALLDDEIKRRLRVRVGTSLPWERDDRQALLNEDSERIRRYLRDEGYFEASVTITLEPVGRYGMRTRVSATLGPRYELGRVEVVPAGSSDTDLAIPEREVKAAFTRGRRFTYARFLADVDKITTMFQRRGYPSVRVIHDFDPLTSFDRRTRKVDVRVTIDPRRKLDVVFEGNDKTSFPDDDLTRQLTFGPSGTADDVEVAASARALERYYQSRGYFDVAITNERVRLGAFDRVVYRIEPGQIREAKNVTIECRPHVESGEVPKNDCSLPRRDLDAAIGTRLTTRRLLGGTRFVTTAQIAADVVALERFYRARGFQEATVRADVAPTQAGWIASAVGTAQVLAEHRPRDLQIRFVVEEGPRTVIEQVHVVFEGRAAGRANAGDEQRLIERLRVKPGDPYVRQTLEDRAKDVADWYWSFGRPRARVTPLEPVPGKAPHSVVVTFNIEERQELRIGEVVVRGNFRTREWVVRDELGFEPGAPLTGDLFTAGPRRLRATNLFDAVKLDFLDFEDSRRDSVNVVVRVEERHDYAMRLDFEAGWSSEASGFVRAKPSWPNLLRVGARIDSAITYGAEYKAVEGTLRLPRWLARRYTPASFDTEVGGYYRQQETERFGPLVSAGTSVAFSRTWERPRSEEAGGRLFTAAARVDWRRRSRDEELVRPPGLAGDLTTNPIITNTGTVGLTLTWDQRRDARGNLNPLAPDQGFRLEAGAAYASKIIGQDTFVKLNALGQIFLTRGRLQLRLDGRYDHGIPLDHAVLLPEVERYFAGGDSTVRGYEEDRLATEIIEETVPPLGQTTQIRVLPAGGNIRALTTADAQVTVWKLGGFPVASALFVDAGLITNTWAVVNVDDIRPAVGSAVRMLLPIGAVSLEYAVPLFPRVGDDPRGRLHFAVALRY